MPLQFRYTSLFFKTVLQFSCVSLKNFTSGYERSVYIFIEKICELFQLRKRRICKLVHLPSRSDALRAGGRAGGRAAGNTAERAGAGRVAGRSGVAGRGRGAEAALPRGRFTISRSSRSATGELPAGPARRRDAASDRVSRGRARRSKQGAGSAAAVGLRGENLGCDQRDVRQRIRRRDDRGAPIDRFVTAAALRALR